MEGKEHPIIDWSPGFRVASFLIYTFVVLVLTIGSRPAYRFRVKGRGNLRGHRKGILAANHCQYIEPALSAVAIWPKRTWFSAEENNVTRKDVGWLTRLLRAFGIPDDNPMAIAGPIKKALERNWFIHFYPEGTLSWRSQEPGPFLEGAFFFAFLNDVPVFPITEVLRERPIRKLLPWMPPRTTFVIGEPIYPAEFRGGDVPRRERVHRMAERVRKVMVDTIAAEGGCATLPERRPPDRPPAAAER